MTISSTLLESLARDGLMTLSQARSELRVSKQKIRELVSGATLKLVTVSEYPALIRDKRLKVVRRKDVEALQGVQASPETKKT